MVLDRGARLQSGQMAAQGIVRRPLQRHAGQLERVAGDRRQGQPPRAGHTDAVALRAAWEEVSEVGYAQLTMEGVAARAGTSKPVLYRRWPNRAALVLAAMRRQVVPISSDIPDTGIWFRAASHRTAIGPGPPLG